MKRSMFRTAHSRQLPRACSHKSVAAGEPYLDQLEPAKISRKLSVKCHEPRSVAFGAPTPEEGAARRLMTPGARRICPTHDNYLDALAGQFRLGAGELHDLEEFERNDLFCKLTVQKADQRT